MAATVLAALRGLVGPEAAEPVTLLSASTANPKRRSAPSAASYAALIGGELRAVIAWDHSPGFGYVPGGYRAFEKEANHTLQRIIDKYRGEELNGEITKRVVQGNPTKVLVQESTGANLLVVGDRGFGVSLGSCSVPSARTAFVTRRAP